MTEMLTMFKADGSAPDFNGALDEKALIHCYRTMLMVRAFDDICMKLQRSGRIGFSIPNKGVEATQVGAASALRATDFFFPSYRDFGMALHHGAKPVDRMHNMFGNASDSARGRQMSVHFSFIEPLRFFSISSPIGTHLPHAVGAAYAAQALGKDDVSLASFGDGGTSSAGFHSALNLAGVWKAPVIFLCQNNGWAISLPASGQTASDGYAIKAKAYGMPGVTVDGNDLLAVNQAVGDAAKRARGGEGPTLIEAYTYRMGGHSTSDDPTKYVPAEELEEWAKKDPVLRMQRFLDKSGLWDETLEEKLLAECADEVAQAAKVAEATPGPTLETIFSDVYETLPLHLRRQGEQAFELAERKGGADAGGGAFPL